MTQKINTKPLPGFMELLPGDQIAFEKMKNKISSIFSLSGFVPMDTPTIERQEVLFSKAGGETEKQIYQIQKGDDLLALRFDLTVPLARYVSEYERDLIFPFRRYQIGKVFRGERSQRGRYREFYQCDVDIIDKNNLDLANDAELINLIYTIFKNLELGNFIIRINNRKILNGLLNFYKIKDRNNEVLRLIDKLEKIDRAEIIKGFQEIETEKEVAEKILKAVSIKNNFEDAINDLEKLEIDESEFQLGLLELKDLYQKITEYKISNEFIQLDLSIARGLDYYTGTVFETNLLDYENFGSVCSGGRYDNLTEQFTKTKMPGVGFSIGLTRLFSQLKEAGKIDNQIKTSSQFLIIPMINSLEIPNQYAEVLRKNNISVEIYVSQDKLKNKLEYANKLGIKNILLLGEDEISKNIITFKNMDTGEQKEVSIDSLLDEIKN